MGCTVDILQVTLFMPLGVHVYVYLYVYTVPVKDTMAECILPAAVVDICQFRVELKISHGNIQRWKARAIDRCDVFMAEIIEGSMACD